MSRCSVVVAGTTDSAEFQRAKAAAEAIGTSSPRDVVCEVSALTEFGWSEHRANKVQQHGAAVREVTETVLITVDGSFQQNVAKFVEWAAATFSYAEGSSDWGAVAKSAYDAFLADPNSTFVSLDVSIGTEAAEQMVFQLDKKTCPITSANFAALAVGAKPAAPPHLGFLDTIFHRVQEGGWVQGGDINSAEESGSFDLSGTGGASIFGATFPDENFIIEHSGRGVLFMANSGIHTNGSQFGVSFRAMPWMDKKYVAFGKLVSGTAVLDKLEGCPTANGRPTQPCKISACGVFPEAKTVELAVATDVEGIAVQASFKLYEKWTVPMAVSGSARFAAVFGEATEIRINTTGEATFSVTSITWDGASKLAETVDSKAADGLVIAL